MQGKELFLKNKSKIIILVILTLIIFYKNKLIAEENPVLIETEVRQYLMKTNEFSSNFIQTKENDFQEGNFYLKNNRFRIEYNNPSKIIIIVKKNNAMYFNVDLEEVQYFNPKNTIAEVFFNMFNNSDFLNEAKFVFGLNTFSISKVFEIDNQTNKIKIFFEKSPIIIRKIEFENEEGKTTFGIINANHNPNLSDDLFSLANPLLQ